MREELATEDPAIVEAGRAPVFLPEVSLLRLEPAVVRYPFEISDPCFRVIGDVLRTLRFALRTVGPLAVPAEKVGGTKEVFFTYLNILWERFSSIHPCLDSPNQWCQVTVCHLKSLLFTLV
jgi:hypothetical protein